jgi:hypothetical protein
MTSAAIKRQLTVVLFNVSKFKRLNLRNEHRETSKRGIKEKYMACEG